CAWHEPCYGGGFPFQPKPQTTMGGGVIPQIIPPSGSRGVSDYSPCRGANQAARTRGTCRTAGQPANQRTGAATDHGAPQYTVLPPIRASSERQCHRNHGHFSTHPLRPATNDPTTIAGLR